MKNHPQPVLDIVNCDSSVSKTQYGLEKQDMSRLSLFATMPKLVPGAMSLKKSDKCVKLTVHLHIVMKFGMHEILPP